MNRRQFLTRLAKGVAVATITLHLDPQKVASIFGGETALELLTREYQKATKGKGSRSHPTHIYVGQSLFDKLESEITPLFRWVEVEPEPQRPSLMFRAARVTAEGYGWGYRFENRRGV